MTAKSGARCALQMARERRLRVYPNVFGLEQDICDITLWLTTTQGLRRTRLWIDRHYTHIGREIAGVSVMSPPEHRERLTEAARQAFLALGYTIENTGADLYYHATCDGRHSRHETIKAYARIEAALRRWPLT